MTSKRSAERRKRAYASTPEWYTPEWLLERIRAFLGAEFFDPCPARDGQPIAENGLAVRWQGRVFCNPPYGQDIVPWIHKAMTEPVRELILLVPAYTETRWFEPLFACTICFVHNRIYFVRQGKPARAPHPSVLVYRGRHTRQFAEAFCDLGTVMVQRQPRKAKQPRLLSA